MTATPSPTPTSRYALQAERKLGEMLRQTERAKGTAGAGRPKIGGNKVIPPKNDVPTLASLGLSKRESAAAQELGEMLRQTERAKAGRPRKKIGNIMLPITSPTLASLGLTKRESSAAQELGEMLRQTERAKGRLKRGPAVPTGYSGAPTLPQLGLSRKESAAAQELGEMLAATERAKGRAQSARLTGHRTLPVEPTLKEIGISKRESNQYKTKVDRLPDVTDPLTFAADARRAQQQRQRQQCSPSPTPQHATAALQCARNGILAADAIPPIRILKS